MTYEEAQHYLYELESRGWKLDLDRIQEFLKFLQLPHKHFSSIHIAGTNGKGSTAVMIESILRNAGHRTGLYTSPHLVEATERIKVGNKQISKRTLVDYVNRYRPVIDALACTFFETMTAFAFQYFLENKIDVAIVEVGMGGRFDATNVLTPMLSVITDIGYDHTKNLGEKLEQIAREKAGIIKPGIPCLSCASEKSVRQTLSSLSQNNNSRYYEVQTESSLKNCRVSPNASTFDLEIGNWSIHKITLPLVGRHQVRNAQCAVTACHLLQKSGLNVTEKDIQRGLSAVVWPGRFQKLHDQPTVIVDVAHNPSAIRTLRQAVEELYPNRERIFIVGVMADKDYRSMIAEIAPVADRFSAVWPESDRALQPALLAGHARTFIPNVSSYGDVWSGYMNAINSASANSVIIVTGSHYTVGKILASRKKY